MEQPVVGLAIIVVIHATLHAIRVSEVEVRVIESQIVLELPKHNECEFVGSIPVLAFVTTRRLTYFAVLFFVSLLTLWRPVLPGAPFLPWIER